MSRFGKRSRASEELDDPFDPPGSVSGKHHRGPGAEEDKAGEGADGQAGGRPSEIADAGDASLRPEAGRCEEI